MLAARTDLFESLCDLHVARTLDALRLSLARELETLLPSAQSVLLFEDDENATCEWTPRGVCPFPVDADLRQRMIANAKAVLPLSYGGERVGIVLATEDCAPDHRERLDAILAHWTTAVVNQKLSERSDKLLDEYASSLQALQEGVSLFRETDRSAVGARFLDLWCKSLSTEAAAIYVFAEVGNAQSELMLEHTIGVPEIMLESLVDKEGAWWPPSLLATGCVRLERNSNMDLGPLDKERIAPVLRNIIGTPLEYHGVPCGIAIAFNVSERTIRSRTKAEGARRLAELGAALFHRLHIQEELVHVRLLDNQLEIASTLQKRLIPARAPDSSHHRFSWSSTPALYVGGDYVDLYADDDDIVLAIADVSGHGINSAMLMSSYRAGCRAQSRGSSPTTVLSGMNDIIHGEVGDTGMFLTAVHGRITHGGTKVHLASAGHNPILVWRAASQEFERIDSSGPPLGFIPGIEYEESEFELAAGDLLFLYTDGVVEAAPPGTDDMFEMERLQSVIRANAASGAEAVRKAVLDAVEAHAGDGMREDDVSILVVEQTRA
ncbi:MAG: serine/threonine-protein phosphatase [Planctomycetes bacterium]|nr:serine/threonine-protein phosphatase [Planctomycetota bacterium]MCB9917212.1 serine/threonine-protein phosphatase [Planctomycetota bacterium]